MRANCPGTKTYSGSRRTRNDISAGFHRCSQTTGSSVMRAADADATGGAISIDGAVKMGGLDIIRTRMRLRFSAGAQDAASLTNWLRMICSRRTQRCQVFMRTSAKNRRAPSGAAFQAFVLQEARPRWTLNIESLATAQRRTRHFATDAERSTVLRNA